MPPWRAPLGALILPGCLALLVLAWGAPSLAQTPAAAPPQAESEDTSDRPARDAMKAALEHQRELMTRFEAREAAGESDLDELGARAELALGDRADPRIAPQAPVDRPLPLAIFDETPVEIPAGRWGNRRSLSVLMRVLDADRDGQPELVRYVELASQHMLRQEEDRNYDGITDAWSDYEAGELIARVLDSNDDGNPDVWERYQAGRMTSREIDRDDDGVRDAFFRYEGDFLIEERHDADNDGRIDLHISYSDHKRVRAEEDRNRDGRMDVWRTYAVDGDQEYVARIERDRRGRGMADLFETFESKNGRVAIARREEDLNGDGEIDVVSVYENGKLIRRDILSPDLVPL